MKTKSLFLFKVALFSLAFYAIQDELLVAYRWLMYTICRLVVSAPGVTVYLYSLDKLLLFASLLLATPCIAPLLRVLMLAGGTVIFITADLVSLLFSIPADFTQSGVYNNPPSASFFWVWKTYGRLLAPLLVWMLLAHRHIDGLFRLRGTRNRLA